MKKVIIILGLLLGFISVKSQIINLDSIYSNHLLDWDTDNRATLYFNQPKFDNIDTLFLFHIKVYEESIKNKKCMTCGINQDSFIFWEIFCELSGYRFFDHQFVNFYYIDSKNLNTMKKWYLSNKRCLNFGKIKCLIKNSYYIDNFRRLDLDIWDEDRVKIRDYTFALYQECEKQDTFIKDCNSD